MILIVALVGTWMPVRTLLSVLKLLCSHVRVALKFFIWRVRAVFFDIPVVVGWLVCLF